MYRNEGGATFLNIACICGRDCRSAHGEPWYSRRRIIDIIVGAHMQEHTFVTSRRGRCVISPANSHIASCR
jgi:hypothetical protein